MTNYDTSAGLAGDNSYPQHNFEGQVLSRTIDWSKAKDGVTYLTAADTLDVLKIPAGFVVEDVYCKIVTAGTASSTVGCGLSGDNVYFWAAAVGTMDSVAGTIFRTGKAATAAGKFKDIASVTALAGAMVKEVPTADTLRLLIGGTAPIAGKVTFYVRGFMLA